MKTSLLSAEFSQFAIL